MNTTEAVALVSAQLRRRNEDLYAFQPHQQERFFIGEAFVIAAGALLLQAFLKGLTASAQKRVETWGQQLGDWIGDRLETLFRSGASPAQADLEPDISAARSALEAVDAGARTQAAAETRAVLAQAFERRDVPAERAQAYARTAEEAALGVMGG